MNHRALFQSLMDLRRKTFDDKDAQLLQVSNTYHQQVIDLAVQTLKAKKSRRKVPDTFEAARKIVPEQAAALLETFRAPAEELAKKAYDRGDRIKKLLKRVANLTPVPPGDQEMVYDRIYLASYASQGWGANSYARAAAEEIVQDLQLFGIQAQAVFTTLRYKDGPGCECYEVRALVSNDLDLEILRNKDSKMTMRDWVKGCWARGVNPRVYCPGLPVGYEEKVGLDYFGGDRK